MRLVTLEQIKLPVFLSRSIYDKEGKTILTKGTLLNKYYVNRLKELGISAIYVDDNMASLKVDEITAEDTRLHAEKVTKDALSKVKAGEAPEIRKTRNRVKYLINEIMLNRAVMVHLIDIRSLKDHTFVHSINVCVLSLLTGIAMKYPEEQLLELGTGALLHDIGKAMVIDCIVNNKELLGQDDYELMKRHTEYGYDVLKKTDCISEASACIALQHHERIDGSGYPRGIQGSEIHQYARIVAAADVFDALSTDRPYREKLYPHQVVQMLYENKDIQFDNEAVTQLIASIAPYPLGCMVLLNNGVKGIVISIKNEFTALPRVQLLYDEKGCWVSGIRVVDLFLEEDLYISEILK